MTPEKQFIPPPEWGGLNAWSDTLLVNPVLVTPVRHLWQDYVRFCLEDGFPRAITREFVQRLRLVEGVDIKMMGHGRIRRVAIGCAPGRWEYARPDGELSSLIAKMRND